MEGLEEDSLEPVDVANQVRTLVDILLMSAAKAQALHDSESKVHRVGDFIEDYNQQWGRMLSSYVKSWLRDQES